MAFQKKVMILLDTATADSAGLIKLISDGGHNTAEINLQRSEDKKLTVLLKAEARLLAFEITRKATLNLGDIALPAAIDCLVIDSLNKPVLYGSTSRDKHRCFSLLDEFLRQKTEAEIAEKKLVIEDEKQSEIPQISSEIIAENSNNLTDTSDDENIHAQALSDTVETAEKTEFFSESVRYRGENFYLAVKPQLDEMFICYPADLLLQNAVPNSKWVRVATADDYYVVGVIFELDEPKFICYGIHGEYQTKPPDDVKNLCEWLPLDLSEPEGEGYWMMYQSAVDGKTIKKPD